MGLPHVGFEFSRFRCFCRAEAVFFFGFFDHSVLDAGICCGGGSRPVIIDTTDSPFAVKQAVDLRRLPAIPRATKKFERLYKGRTAIERVNARLKVFWGTDDGNVAGGAPFLARVGIAMVVHAGLATLLARTPRKEAGGRTLGRTRLSPIGRALTRRAGP